LCIIGIDGMSAPTVSVTPLNGSLVRALASGRQMRVKPATEPGERAREFGGEHFEASQRQAIKRRQRFVRIDHAERAGALQGPEIGGVRAAADHRDRQDPEVRAA
jgi:hypothetical protein